MHHRHTQKCFRKEKPKWRRLAKLKLRTRIRLQAGAWVKTSATTTDYSNRMEHKKRCSAKTNEILCQPKTMPSAAVLCAAARRRGARPWLRLGPLKFLRRGKKTSCLDKPRPARQTSPDQKARIKAYHHEAASCATTVVEQQALLSNFLQRRPAVAGSSKWWSLRSELVKLAVQPAAQ